MNPQNNPLDLDSLLDRVVLDDPSPEAEADLLRRIHGATPGEQPAEGGMPGVIFSLFALAAVALLSVVLLNVYNRTVTEATEGDASGHFLNPDDFRQKVRCAGVFTEHVIFEDSVTGEQKIYTVGQSLHGYTISAIQGERVTLTGVDDPSDTFTVKLSAGQGGDVAAGVFDWFSIQGALADGEGKSVAGWVCAYDEQNQWIAGAQAKVDGRYAIKSRRRVAYLQAATADYSVLSKRVGSWAADAREDFTLVDDRFRIHGRVTQSGRGVPHAEVIAWHGPRQRVTVARADQEGNFEFKTNRMVFSMKAAIGLQMVVREGPWQADATVDLSMDRIFVVTGTATLDGAAMVTGSLIAYNDNNEAVASGFIQGGQGKFSLSSGMPFASIVLSFRPVGALQEEGGEGAMCAYVLSGFWGQDAAGVAFDMVSSEFRTLKGVVTDETGLPERTTVVAIRRFGDGREYNLASATSDGRGRYFIKTNAEVSVLAAFAAERWNRIDGPWTRDDTVDFRIGAHLAPQRLLDLNRALNDEAKRFDAWTNLRDLIDRFGDVKAGELSAVALLRDIEASFGSWLSQQAAMNDRMTEDVMRMARDITEKQSLLDVALAEEYVAALKQIGSSAPGQMLRDEAMTSATHLETALNNRPLIGFSFNYESEGEGVVVGAVTPGTAAERGGLKSGDRILRIDGTPISSQQEVLVELTGRKPGDRMAIEVEREGEGVVTVYVTLGLRF